MDDKFTEETIKAISLMEPLESLAFRQFQLACLLYEKTENPNQNVIFAGMQILETMKANALGRHLSKELIGG
jgi:hypothetical protein